MGKIITVASHKGGVGKTTTALNLGYSLSRLGPKVLMVDADPQGGMAAASNLKKRTTLGLLDLLRNQVSPQKVVARTRDKKIALVGVGVSEPEDSFFFEREVRKGALAKIIRDLAQGFDYVLIDTPAGVTASLAMILGLSDSVLVPLNCNILTVRTLPMFLKLIRKLRRKMNPDLLLEGVLVTMVPPEETASSVLSEIRNQFPQGVAFETVIYQDETFERASLKYLPVGMLPGGENPARSYLDLAVELKTRELSFQARGIEDEDIEGLF